MTEGFLSTATAIGTTLCRRALWQGRECNWNVPATVGGPPIEPLGSDIYGGTGGIALFLGFLYRATGRPEIRRCARGAAEHARVRALESLSAEAGTVNVPFAFYTGRLGVAWMLTCLGPLLGEDRWNESGLEVLEALRARQSEDFGVDVISGAAGAIPPLLDVHARTGRPFLLEIARRLGDHLLEVARREAVGWSWDSFPPWVVRNLTGLSHGAAGMGRALLELYAVTGDGRYRYGAEQAFLFEDRSFDRVAFNWPDFRLFGPDEYVDLKADAATGRLSVSGDVAGLRRAVSEGRISLTPRFMSTWCHGAPGIGLTRLRAYQLLAAARFERAARLALKGTKLPVGNGGSAASLRAGALSLCHGLGGGIEFLLTAHDVLGDARYRNLAEAVVRKILGRDRSNSRLRWEVADPGLMLGCAGIGYLLLRLHDFRGVPSILLPCPESPASGGTRVVGRREPDSPQDDGRKEAARLRDEYVRQYFGRTLEALCQSVRRSDANRLFGGFAWGRPDVELAALALRRSVGRLRGRTRQLVADAFERERQRFLAARRPSNVGPQLLEALLKPPPSALDWNRTRFQLHPGVRLLATSDRPLALLPHQGRILEVSLSLAEWQVIHRLRRPRSLAQICRVFETASIAAANGAADDRRTIPSVVTLKALLERAYRLSIIRVDPKVRSVRCDTVVS